MKSGEILLEVVRNEMVESVHSGHLLILDGAGREVLSLGDPDEIIYPRSAIKSLQASAMVRSGLKLSAEQLAIVCASHAGSEAHLKNVLSILATYGRSESDLKNTPDRPLGSAERSAWGERPASSLAANCSGKHAGMVATCVAQGWDVGRYKNVTHPLQVAIRREIETLTGSPVAKVGVDGCGAPLFAMSLRAMARAVLLPYIVMQWLRGDTLGTYRAKVGRVPLPEILRIGREIAEGLAAAHESGLVHRDIKPENIVLEGPARQVKIIDFGLARGAADEASTTGITLDGAVVGTPAYMAPERLGDRVVDARADLFGLGVMLYELLADRLPFTGNSMMAMLASISRGSPPPLANVAAEVPEDVSSLVMRLIAHDPADRPATARAVADEIAAIEKRLGRP